MAQWRTTIAADSPPCEHHEPPVDCRACGACCREAFHSVPVEDTDVRTLIHQPDLVVVHADGWRDLARTGPRCAALTGDGQTSPFRCRIYTDRPAACSGLPEGSASCLLARRRVGLSAPAEG